MPRTAQTTTSDFLSGLVTHDGIMIALIDLPQLLSTQDGRRPAGNEANPPARH